MPIVKRIMNMNILKRLAKGKLRLRGGQRGFSLVETLLALAILGVIGIAFSSGIFVGLRATEQTALFVTVDRLARNQLEDIKNASYDETLPLEYPTIATIGDYSITIDVEKIGDGDGGTYQTITVTILQAGEAVWAMDTLKVKGL